MQMIGNAFSIAVLVAIGLAFVQALAHKLRNPRSFARSVREYELLPGPLAVPASAFLILAEVFALALILSAIVFPGGALPDTPGGWPARMGLAAAASLLAIYGLAMGANLLRKKFGLDCGCTAGSTPISAGLVLRNFVLVGFAAVALAINDFSAAGLPLGLPGGAAFFLAYLTATQLMSNRVSGTVLGNTR